MSLPPRTNPPGSLQDDLRFLERWVWIGGLLACFLLIATVVMAAVFLGGRNGSMDNGGQVLDYNYLIVSLQYAINALAFGLHGALLLSAAQRFAQARNSGGSVASGFRILRWTIIVDGIALLTMAALYLFPTQLV
jgi:hypothetical protein